MKTAKKIFAAVFLLAFTLVLLSCGGGKNYTNSLKLSASYEGKEFIKDGIGKVELYSTVDGDTAWFKSAGTEIKIRFSCVDTPESTGAIEPWGKAASTFTSNILKKAHTLVLQAQDGKAATLDSTGTRYLAFVWYQLQEADDFRNLNLELVEEGYSKSKVDSTALYQDDFNSAATAAMKRKAYVWSSEQDPNYDYGTGQLMTIKEVCEQAADYYGRRVNFEAFVSRIDNNYAYVQNDVDGETYGMLVYLGYDQNLLAAFKKGNKLRVHGFVQEYNGLYQISGCIYDRFEKGSTDSKWDQYVRVLATGQQVEAKEITATELNNKTVKMRTFVTLKDLTVTDIYSGSEIVGDSISKQMTVTCTVNGQKVQLRTSALYDNARPITENDFRNKLISSVSGIVTEYQNVYQLQIVSFGDVVFA